MLSLIISFLISLLILDKFKLSNNTLIRKLQLLVFMIISVLVVGYISMYITGPFYCDRDDGSSSLDEGISSMESSRIKNIDTEKVFVWIL